MAKRHINLPLGILLAIVPLACVAQIVTPPMQGQGREPGQGPEKRAPVAAPMPVADRSTECNAQCLTDIAKQYLSALEKRDFTPLRVAPNLLVSENGHYSRIGENLWKVLEKLGPDRHYYTDPISGNIITIGTLEQSAQQPFIYVLRLKVENRLVAEVETMVIADTNAGQHFRPDNIAKFDSTLLTAVPTADRMTRQELTQAADAMWFGGATITKSSDCIHWENADRLPQFTCSTGIKPGRGGLFNAQRAVRHPLIDVEHGLVFTYVLQDASPYQNPNPPDDERTPRFYQGPVTFTVMQIAKFKRSNTISAHHLFMTVQEAALPAVFVE
ncbi:MAG: hypothetical protein QM808_04145 [Steroidobacteraceae bacterium]